MLARCSVSSSSPFSRWIISRPSSTKLFVGVVSSNTDLSFNAKLGDWRFYLLKKVMFLHLARSLQEGLSYDTNETILKDAFEPHGEIIEVKVICNHVSGKSKGYGFVHFTTENAASNALKEMNGKKHSCAVCPQKMTAAIASLVVAEYFLWILLLLSCMLEEHSDCPSS
ncbi:hypothetical protein M9H77_15930 [Catharanthus roseus]|uniref:Uncharacterized protein n=1 Tax=Catharanthus roseus TaxID=4058 RepID=A0ACC0B0V3_CATRO|nr:hypothetical protein M9H77_15930 [Catharanthus roseus]